MVSVDCGFCIRIAERIADPYSVYLGAGSGASHTCSPGITFVLAVRKPFTTDFGAAVCILHR